MKVFLYLSLLHQFAFANVPHPETFKWENLEIVWLNEPRYPTFDVHIYFEQGALSDQRGHEGETHYALNSMNLGTNRYSQEQIADALEYYGISYGAQVVHEYSVFNVSGLNKDIIPAFKMICHLFRNATYPQKKLSKLKLRATSGLKNIVTNHSALTERVFRQVSLKKTPFELPASGTLKSVSRMSSKRLRKKLDYFTGKVKKKIYISSSASKEVFQNIFLSECGWGKEDIKTVATTKKSSSRNQGNIYFVPVENANQAQIRVGRFLDPSEIEQWQLLDLISSYLGGGFTSVLMQELRVKRGLTYSAYAVASEQKNYGRAIVATFTKNNSVKDSLQVIRDTLAMKGQKDISQDLAKNQGYIAGHFLFGLEKNSSFLAKLLFFEHAGHSFDELMGYTEKIRSFKEPDVRRKIGEIFDWNKLDVLVLGHPSILEQLGDFDKKVVKLNFRKYL